MCVNVTFEYVNSLEYDNTRMSHVIQLLTLVEPVDNDGVCVYCRGGENNHDANCPWLVARKLLPEIVAEFVDHSLSVY